MLKKSLTHVAKGLLVSTIILITSPQYANAHFKKTKKPTFEDKSESLDFNRAGGGFASSESPWPTFGLGRWARKNFIKVIWPSGLTGWFLRIRREQTIDIVEGTGRWQYHR